MAEAEYYAVVTGAADGLDASQCLDGFQGTRSDPVEKRSGEDEARRVKISVAARGDLSGRVKMRRVPGEHILADQLTMAKSWHEIVKMIRGVAGRREVTQGHEKNQPGMKVAGVRNDLERQQFNARGAPKGRQSGISIRAAVVQTTAAAGRAEGAAAASLCGTEMISMVGLHAAGKIIILFNFRPFEVVTTFPIIGFTVEPLEMENIHCTLWDVGGHNLSTNVYLHEHCQEFTVEVQEATESTILERRSS